MKEVKTETDSFIVSTAKDYDISVYNVLRIYNTYPYDEFYERLEEFIKQID